MKELNYEKIDNLLRLALDEDIGTGDITTIACVPETAVSNGRFIAKEPGVISGLDVLMRVFELIDDSVSVTKLVSDGDSVRKSDVIATISGPSRAILTGERTALNFLQHMSAIATRTAEAVREIDGTKTKILDTRKTTPGLRAIEKYAVTCGGGTNHRYNLADGVLIKDNHINAAGGITNAVKQTKLQAVGKIKIEVETETLEQVKEALSAGADIIMLDNMAPDLMAEAVKLINGRALTEASGNMGERDLKTIAETGVDFISIGALTHSVKAMDISLRFD
ncbi:MAG: carboxylating nicotinate-nucleotide diphosphorylase [Oscillospiraceae bacterium]|nr:carboxylating nicotinate-nucleotide diphosphorylase [Oscillospiraceae bacterium]